MAALKVAMCKLILNQNSYIIRFAEKSMKILLIQSKMNMRPMDTNLKTQMSPPLALFTLVSLTPPEHDVVVVNENIEQIPYDFPADLVGFTITLDVFPRACEIAKNFRTRNILTVAGGIHVTCSPNKCIDHFDTICIGPAESLSGRSWFYRR